MSYTVNMVRLFFVSLLCCIGCSRPTTWSTPPDVEDSGNIGSEEGVDGSLDTENGGEEGDGDESSDASGDAGDDSSDDGGAGTGSSGEETSGGSDDGGDDSGPADDGGSGESGESGGDGEGSAESGGDEGDAGESGGGEGTIDTGEILDTAAPSGGGLDGSYCGTWAATIDMSGWVDTYASCTCEIYVSGEDIAGVFDPCYSASAGIEFYGDILGTLDLDTGDGSGTFYMGGTPHLDFESTLSGGVLDGMLTGTLSGGGMSAVVDGTWTTTWIKSKSCP